MYIHGSNIYTYIHIYIYYIIIYIYDVLYVFFGYFDQLFENSGLCLI